MLLLNKNAEPEKTILYLSAIIYGIILKGLKNIDDIYLEVQIELEEKLNFNFFVLALDFLFLLNKININSKGDIEVVY